MRITILAIATLFLYACSSSPVVRDAPPAHDSAVTSLENADVHYDPSVVPEVTLDSSTAHLAKVIAKTDPRYPPEALRAKTQGNVYVRALIAPDGRVRRALILKSDDTIFNRPSLEAALKWRFEPPVVAGRSAAVWVYIPFRFRVAVK